MDVVDLKPGSQTDPIIRVMRFAEWIIADKMFRGMKRIVYPDHEINSPGDPVRL
jgi:hypothetical protein